MGHPVEFHGQNKALFAHPSHADHVSPEPLPIFSNGYACASCWQLDPAELAEVYRTGRVFVTMLSGESMPAHFVGSEESAHRCLLAMDLGRAFERTPPAPDTRQDFVRLADELRPAFSRAAVASGNSETLVELLGPALFLLLRDSFNWPDDSSDRVAHIRDAIDHLGTAMKTCGLPMRKPGAGA